MNLTAGERAAHGFFAAFLGWLAPFAASLAWQQLRNDGEGRVTDLEFWLFWPLVVTAGGWLLVWLPFSLTVSEKRARQLGFVISAAVVASMLAFGILTAIFGSWIVPLVWWPLATGVIGGASFWLLATWRPRWSALLWLAPLLFFGVVRWVLLPLGLALFPYLTWQLTEGALSAGPLLAVIERVEVGDSFEELHRRYPRIFEERSQGVSLRWSDGSSYTVVFDADRRYVVEVRLRRGSSR